jgi:hypothetical protein
MNPKLAIVVAAAAAFVGSVAVAHVQPVQPTDHWQMVAGNGGDGGNAWLFNVDSGQTFFCYRRNCVMLDTSGSSPR